MTKWERPLAAAAAVAAAAWSFGAEAHVAGGVPGGFAGGFAHPLTGPDHFLAMLAVGIWALVELGCLRGTVGPNRHGPDPLAAQPA